MCIDTRSMFKSQAGDFVDLVGAGGACASAVAPDCRRTDDRCFDVFRVRKREDDFVTGTVGMLVLKPKHQSVFLQISR